MQIRPVPRSRGQRGLLHNAGPAHRSALVWNESDMKTVLSVSFGQECSPETDKTAFMSASIHTAPQTGEPDPHCAAAPLLFTAPLSEQGGVDFLNAGYITADYARNSILTSAETEAPEVKEFCA